LKIRVTDVSQDNAFNFEALVYFTADQTFKFYIILFWMVLAVGQCGGVWKK